jgi:hypothetical protein
VSLGEVWWVFDQPVSTAVIEILDSLSSRGLPVRHPQLGTVFDIDETGSRREHESADSLLAVVPYPPLTLQLWLGSSTDVILSVETDSLITLALDGLSLAEANHVLFGVLSAALAVSSTLGVVADRDLPDTGDLWDEYFAGRILDTPAADLLLRRGEGSYEVILRNESWLKRTLAP